MMVVALPTMNPPTMIATARRNPKCRSAMRAVLWGRALSETSAPVWGSTASRVSAEVAIAQSTRGVPHESLKDPDYARPWGLPYDHTRARGGGSPR